LEVKEAIENRRAYRALTPVKITYEMIEDLAGCASLAPSCFNYQPWQYVFVYELEQLKKMHDALSPGNEWARAGSMFIAVFSKKEEDCVIKEREYYLFDTGMATALMILRATELGLVAHPIAGFSPKKTRAILGIPDEFTVITLIIVGKHLETASDMLSEEQKEVESIRPARKELKEFVHINRYNKPE
jgi:nitroreductase